MDKVLTKSEFETLKKYYEDCIEPKPDIFSLIATVEDLYKRLEEGSAREIEAFLRK